MTCVLAATTTELAELQPVRRGLLILGRHVVPTLAILALKHNVIAWHNFISDFRLPIANLLTDCPSIGNRQLAIGNAFIQQRPKPCRLRLCGRLHESRTVTPSPS